MYINECRTERMGAEAWSWDDGTDGQHDRARSRPCRGDADQRRHRRPRRSLLGAGQGDVLHPLRPARAQLRELPRAELRQLHPRRPPEPGPDQRLPGLPSEDRQAVVDPQPLQGLHSRHAGRDLQSRFARVHRAGDSMSPRAATDFRSKGRRFATERRQVRAVAARTHSFVHFDRGRAARAFARWPGLCPQHEDRQT